MRSEEETGIRTVFTERGNLIAIIAVACGLGFAISTFAGLLTSSQSMSEGVALLLAVSALLLSASFLYRGLAKLLFSEETISGVLITDKNGEPISVSEYDFMEDFSHILSAVRVENKAIYADWERNRLNDWKMKSEGPDDAPSLGVESISMSDEEFFAQNSSAKLAEEICFFIVLDNISTHLTDYFNLNNLTDKTETLARDDIPSFLLKNRIVKLLSTPIDQREVFLEEVDKSKKPKGRLISAFGANGAYFSEFDLVVPSGSKVQPLGHNGIHLKNRVVDLKVTVQITPFGASVPKDFCKFYLDTESSVSTRVVWVKIQGRLRHFAILSMRSHSLYGWLDSLRLKLRRDISFETFLERINWKTVRTVLFALGVARNAAAPTEAGETPKSD